MFGYIFTSKLDLTFRQYFCYKSYYCGVCKSLRRNHGLLSKFLLNYDITFLALLLTSLYADEQTTSCTRCIVNPLIKRKVFANEYIDYCSNINVLLAYYKLRDNIQDEKSISSIILSLIFKNQFKNAKKNYPLQERIIQQYLDKLNEIENFNDSSLDSASEAFGSMLGELFIYKDNNNTILKKIGYNIGKYIYIIDCYDDLEKDIKKSRFNPLKSFNNDAQQYEVCNRIEAIISELEEDIKCLKIKHSQNIIENIINLGLRNKAKHIIERKNKG